MNKDEKHLFSDLESMLQDSFFRTFQAHTTIQQPLPGTPDLDQLWQGKVSRSLMEDCYEYFDRYPVASLAWAFFTGMAAAQYWETAWAECLKMDDFYQHLRNNTRFEDFDDYIHRQVLHSDPDLRKDTDNIAMLMATNAIKILMEYVQKKSLPFEYGVLVALRCLYTHGAALALHRMGYKMTAL